MKNYLKPLTDKNAQLVTGGCCGTTPEYTTLLAEKARKHKPRKF
ncbi:MAG: hypothetical protein PHR81_03110 [Bacteroidales bacterium]|nr:hypothetical protein [Bacteroidales bacterium]